MNIALKNFLPQFPDKFTKAKVSPLAADMLDDQNSTTCIRAECLEKSARHDGKSMICNPRDTGGEPSDSRQIKVVSCGVAVWHDYDRRQWKLLP
jgi:hypothetical protein